MQQDKLWDSGGSIGQDCLVDDQLSEEDIHSLDELDQSCLYPPTEPSMGLQQSNITQYGAVLDSVQFKQNSSSRIGLGTAVRLESASLPASGCSSSIYNLSLKRRY